MICIFLGLKLLIIYHMIHFTATILNLFTKIEKKAQNIIKREKSANNFAEIAHTVNCSEMSKQFRFRITYSKSSDSLLQRDCLHSLQ